MAATLDEIISASGNAPPGSRLPVMGNPSVRSTQQAQNQSDIVTEPPTLQTPDEREASERQRLASHQVSQQQGQPRNIPLVPHSSQYHTQSAAIADMQRLQLQTAGAGAVSGAITNDALMLILSQMQAQQGKRESQTFNAEGLKIGTMFLSLMMFFGTCLYAINTLSSSSALSTQERIILDQQSVISEQSKQRPICILAVHCPDTNH